MNKEFRVSDLFGKAQHRKYHNPKDLTEDINGYPYICASNFNNGMNSTMPYVSGDNLDLTPAKIIAWGKQCPVFCYHDKPCVVSQGMYFLDMSNYSELVALYICGVLTATCHDKYGYVNCLIGSKMDDEIISLPVTPAGTPDWSYMEEYMRGIQSRADAALDALSAVCSADDIGGGIETRGWKKFRVGDLFDIHPTKAYELTNHDLFDDGNNPVVVNSAYNNGIGGYTTQPCTEKGNIITFSDTTTADAIFYQKSAFVGYPHVQGMYPRGTYADKWNSNTLKFFATVFHRTALSGTIDYVNKFTREIASQLFIKLPVTPAGTPDWDYMEAYMRRIEKRAEQALDTLSFIEQVAV